jgi:membrane-bound lytic murein transglycosylase A
MRHSWLLPALLLSGCALPHTGSMAPLPDGTTVSRVELADLPGWVSGDQAAALATFVGSCRTINRLPADQSLGGTGALAAQAGQAGLWQNACNAAEDVTPGNEEAAQDFFQTYFTAYRVDHTALITGYFEPEYPGSENFAHGYTVPLYAYPAVPDLADLPRAAIDHGALYRKVPVTAYLRSPVDAFMLQIQGAGIISLPDGHTLRVGFDGQNGQAYTPIGRILVQDGDLAADDVSFQSISAWLKAHPEQAQAIMEQNARYVFLKPLGGLAADEGAPGALGVPLTAGRSLAVDRAVIPLGMPVYITTTDPLTHAPLDRLTIAQDTGGGIHGAAAADLYFGSGPDAEATAGRMQQAGELYLLLPRQGPTT